MRFIHKGVSVILSLMLFFESISTVCCAKSDLSNSIYKSNAEVMYSDLLRKDENPFEPFVVVATKNVGEREDKQNNKIERFIVEKVVEKKYFGCGNLIDLESEITVSGIGLAICDIFFDLTKGRFFGEELLRLKVQPHEKALLQYIVSDVLVLQKDEKATSGYDGEKGYIQRVEKVKYKILTDNVKFYDIEIKYFETGNLEEIRKIKDSATEIHDRAYSSNSLVEITKITEKADNKQIGKTWEFDRERTRIVECDETILEDRVDVLGDRFLLNRVGSDTESILTRLTIDCPQGDILENTDKGITTTLGTKVIINVNQFEEKDNIDHTKDIISSEIIETTSIVAGVSAADDAVTWGREGVRIRKAESGIDVIKAGIESIDTFILKGAVLVVDKGVYDDRAMKINKIHEDFHTETKNFDKQTIYLVKEICTHEYVNITKVDESIRLGNQKIEYDYLIGKMKVIDTNLQDSICHSTVTDKVEKIQKHYKAFDKTYEDTFGEEVDVTTATNVNKKVVTDYMKLEEGHNILLSRWILGEKFFDDNVVDNKQLNCDPNFFAMFEFCDIPDKENFVIVDKNKVEKIRIDGKPELVKTFKEGNIADWWVIGNLGNLISKLGLDADAKYADYIYATLDTVDVVFLVSMGISATSAFKTVAKKAGKYGTQKLVKQMAKKMTQNITEKFLKKKGLTESFKAGGKIAVYQAKEYARDYATQYVLEISGHPELATVVAARRKLLSLGKIGLGGSVGKLQRLPRGGEWAGGVGNSYYKPNMNDVPKQFNPGNLTNGDIYKKHGVGDRGIRYKDGFADFKQISSERAKIPYPTSDIKMNFHQYHRLLKDKFNKKKYLGDSNWTETKVKDYIKNKNMTIHENKDGSCELVHRIIHANLPHRGLRSFMKTDEWFKDKFNQGMYSIGEMTGGQNSLVYGF